MNPRRFDALINSLGHGARRRTILGALLAALVTPLPSATVEGNRGRAKDRDRGRGHGKGTGQERRKKHRGSQGDQRAQAEAACYGGSPCIPGPGKNLGKCNFADSPTLKNKNLKGANLGSATVARGDASGANFQSANLDKLCLVDANLAGARLTGATNSATAIFCRTTMPDGSENNAGCGNGTPCCPTCDDENTCDEGEVCCNGRCREGECCTVDDCEAETCQQVRCRERDLTCVYREVDDGASGTNCEAPRQCCGGECCSANEKCCGGECIPEATCCNDGVTPSCAGDEICCSGSNTCIPVTSCCSIFEKACPVVNPLCCGLPGQAGVCAGCCEPGDVCLSTRDCCLGALCNVDGRCCNQPNGFCTSGEECCSGSCFNSQCM